MPKIDIVINRPKKQTRFLPTTRVRNQYESVDPVTGKAVLNLDEYNVNATKNVNMPGVTMHNRRFRSHSKSALQRSIAEVKRIKAERNEDALSGVQGRYSNASDANLNLGWRPAISSVGNNKPAMSKREAYNDMASMRDYFGNAWTTAQAVRNNAGTEKRATENASYSKYIAGKTALEKDFFAMFGVKAPTVFKREIEQDVQMLQNDAYAGKLTMPEYDKRQDAIQQSIKAMRATFNAMPEKPKQKFDDAMNALEQGRLRNYNMAAKTFKNAYNSVVPGNPYPNNTTLKRSLANRLRNAALVAEKK